MLKKSRRFIATGLVVMSGVWGLVWTGAAHAEPGRQGLYAGLELGFANAADLSSTLSGVNHPTGCDVLVDPDDMYQPYNTDPACLDTTPQTISANSFNPGTGFLGGFSAGYALNGFRFEFEYMYRSHGGDTNLSNAPPSNTALATKIAELNPLALPSERISGFNAHQFFLNAYYDFFNATRWTPYVGVGVGFARTSLDYRSHYIRATSAQGYPDTQAKADAFDGVVRPPAAAGTLSLWEDEVSDTSFGFQFLGGLDYALSDKVSIGMKGRWVHFNEISHSGVWDLIRSHEPVQADGTTPYRSSLTFDDIQYWALTFGMKYYF